MKRTLIALLLSASLAYAESTIVFQELPVGDSVYVTYTSSGCFHHFSYEFEIQRGEAFTAKVTEVRYQQRGGRVAKQVKAKRIFLGNVGLTEQEVIGLDRLFAFYRSNKRMGCTTMDQISATQKSGDYVKTTELFTDGSCAVDDWPNVTPLSSIVAKLQKNERSH